MDVTLVTGNQHKADQYAAMLDAHVDTAALELDEIQSLDIKEILEAKAREAYRILGRPVFVDDVSYVIDELNGVPGPFVKWILKAIGTEGLCRMADLTKTRKATVTVGIGYCDKDGFKPFISEGHGVVADHPKGSGGFGWDSTLVQDGWQITRAELSADEYEKASIRKVALSSLKEYLHR